MVQLILADGDHTFDASLKTITLAAPYTALSEGQILKIVDLTTKALIYDADTRQYPISITGAVITHTYDETGMADTDLLQVIIDVGVFFLISDNAYSTTGALDFTSEQPVFEIAADTRYEIINAWIDLTPFTAADVVTIQMYRSVSAAGGTYRKAGSPISFTVGTDNPVVELSDVAHYGYIKFVASSVPGRTVDVPFGYIKKPLE